MSPSQSDSESKVFLNYRREDSKEVASRLHDDLEFALGTGQVFIDLTRIRPGQTWPTLIRDRLNTSVAVVAVIGRDWLKVQDPDSFQRRLDAEDDWVRRELEEALQEQKVVIPVLVRDAVMPTEAQLPPSIRALAGRQAISIPAEDWKRGVASLLSALTEYGITSVRDLADRPARTEPSMLGVIDYFYRRMSQAASSDQSRDIPVAATVRCAGMSDLWQFIDDLALQEQPLSEAPLVHLQGQLSPYAPLLFGNPMHKRQLHLELRQGAVQLIEELGYEFGELLNGLLSYSAGQMVIRPYFRTKYAFLGLYESIVRNSIPIMIDRKYYTAKLASLFRQFNSLDVSVQACLGEIPNYTQDALNDFGVTERLRSILGDETITRVGNPNLALFVDGNEETFIDVPESSDEHPRSSRYLDGDVWIANAANSFLSRFIDISSREDMLNAVTAIHRELHTSSHGRGTVSSFDVRIAQIEDTIPDRVLSAEQLGGQDLNEDVG